MKVRSVAWLVLLSSAALCAQAQTCNDVLNRNACNPRFGGCSTCGNRIRWLRENRGLSEAEARRSVAGSFPNECGPCGPNARPAPQPAPRPQPRPRPQPQPRPQPRPAPRPQPQPQPRPQPQQPVSGDLGRVVCPVIAMMMRRGLLRPDQDGFITRQQTLDAFIAGGVPRGIAQRTVNTNFRGQGCRRCSDRVNPFRMNVVPSGQVRNPPTNGPQEHFRSTGIRDTDNGQVDQGRMALVERQCLGNNQDWTSDRILCMANVFDSDPGCGGTTSNDVTDNKRPRGCGRCQSFSENPRCRSQLQDSLLDLFNAFRNGRSTISRQDFRRMYIEALFPQGR